MQARVYTEAKSGIRLKIWVISTIIMNQLLTAYVLYQNLPIFSCIYLRIKSSFTTELVKTLKNICIADIKLKVRKVSTIFITPIFKSGHRYIELQKYVHLVLFPQKKFNSRIYD